MAEYKGIHGTKIQNYTADPDNAITGQVWYNETSQTMKFQYPTTINAWSTGGNLNSVRDQVAGAGTQTSGLVFAGNGVPVLTITESYDGTSWTEVNDMNTGRRGLAGAGADNTSSLAFSGINPPSTTTATELWNGTCWSADNPVNTYRGFGGGTGISTSAIVTRSNPLRSKNYTI